MYKVVEIGEQAVPMLSNATTPYRFKQLFGVDLLSAITKLNKDDVSEVCDISNKLAFILSCAADKKDMNKLTEDMFMEWLERFEPMAFVKASREILGLYLNSAVPKSEPKNE